MINKQSEDIESLKKVVLAQQIFGEKTQRNNLAKNLIITGISTKNLIITGISTKNLIITGISTKNLIITGISTKNLIITGISTKNLIITGISTENLIITGISTKNLIITGISTENLIITGISAKNLIITGISTKNLIITGISTENLIITGISTENLIITGISTKNLIITGISTENLIITGISTENLIITGISTENLIITGISTENFSYDDQELVTHEEKLNVIFTDIGLSINPEQYAFPPGEGRNTHSIKITVNHTLKKQILEKAKLLKETVFKGVFIKTDEPKMTRDENYRLMKKSRELKAQFPNSEIKLAKGILTQDGVKIDKFDLINQIF